ncbi:MAG: DUF6941 family protein, partial [Ardenticatenaceae bacterium]
LYLTGGGWDSVALHRPDRTHQFGLAVALRVPWQETNQTHQVTVEITDEELRHTLVKVEADLEVGRTAGLPAGSSQIAQFAFNASSTFERPGDYVVLVRIEEEISGRFPFRAIFGPSIALPPPS